MLILESRSITLWEHFYLRSMLGRSDGLVSLQSALNPHSADAVHKTSIHAFAQSARIGSGQGSSYTGMVTINGGAVHVKQLPIGTSQAFPVSFNRAANTKLLTLKYESFCCVHTYWVCHATRGSEATNATICSILRGGCEHRVEERSLYLKIQGQPPAESTARSIVQVWCVSHPAKAWKRQGYRQLRELGEYTEEESSDPTDADGTVAAQRQDYMPAIQYCGRAGSSSAAGGACDILAKSGSGPGPERLRVRKESANERSEERGWERSILLVPMRKHDTFDPFRPNAKRTRRHTRKAWILLHSYCIRLRHYYDLAAAETARADTREPGNERDGVQASSIGSLLIVDLTQSLTRQISWLTWADGSRSMNLNREAGPWNAGTNLVRLRVRESRVRIGWADRVCARGSSPPRCLVSLEPLGAVGGSWYQSRNDLPVCFRLRRGLTP
ncbi:hypothetical protein TgHK011_008456 [Trichoderma gracile]|nr:hypothetical protein TgHK011_008456 [Trichoderma gracile]